MLRMACGVVEVVLSYFGHGEEGAVERLRNSLTVCDYGFASCKLLYGS